VRGSLPGGAGSRHSVDFAGSTLPVLEGFMRRPLITIVLLALAVSASACAASKAPGWTYAPPTPSPAVTPAPSGASAAPTAASAAPGVASAAPSAGSAGQTPGADGQSPAAGVVVQVSALNMTFEQAALAVPAGTDFVIHFSNKDVGTQHNVEIRDSMGMSLFKGDFVTGAAEVDYRVKGLPAGKYTFNCSIHLNMTGTLTVGG
jgi:plastocyanin